MADYGHELRFGTFLTPTNAQPDAVVGLAQLSEQVIDSDNPARYADVDFNGGARIGRITVWASGECDLEAIDAHTGEQILWESVVVGSDAALGAEIERYIRTVANVDGNKASIG